MQTTSEINERNLQEVNHKVRNNLQMISSILDLQVVFAGDKTTEEIVKTVQQRIHSMVMLHEQMHESQSGNETELATYIENVARQTCQQEINQAEINFRLEKIMIKQEQVIPIGLIINELVSNSIQYANIDPKSTKMWLSGVLTNENYTIVFRDNGKGFDFFAEEKSKKLGLRLIRGLVKQLRGTIEYELINGLECRISIPL